MLTFYRTAPCEGLVGGFSPYVGKLDLWLRMARIPHEPIVMVATEAMSTGPRNLSPYIELDGEQIGDSSVIIQHLKKLYNDPLDDGRLLGEQVIIGELVKSMCEYDLFYIMAYGRYGDDRSDYKSLCKFNIGDLPEDQLNEAVEGLRAFVQQKLDSWTIGRYEPEYVMAELKRCLGVLSNVLADQPYLFGDHPSTYDSSLFGMLAAIIHFPFRNPQVEVAREYNNLVEYCDRVRATYYDYEPCDILSG